MPTDLRVNDAAVLTRGADIAAALHEIDRALLLIATDRGLGVAFESDAPPAGKPIGRVPACRLGDLGDPGFRADHGLRYAYMAGSMANGIGSAEIVAALGRAGMLGSFGAAGLAAAQVERAIDALQDAPIPRAFNLIHSPNEHGREAEVVDLYLRRGVGRVEASAFLDVTLPLVRYRVAGIHRDADGRIATPNRVIAKVSRVEVAEKFFAPPPERALVELLAQGVITEEQAALARRIPLAQDLTAEADSAGHTDNRPALALVPTMLALRDRLQQQYGYDVPLRVGAAGGIATPAATAAAFAMGAAWVLTGSINQACVEAGTCDEIRRMLAEAGQADVAMAPAADMFETGVKVQVLKRGTMFAMRAAKLYRLYCDCDSLEAIPREERARLEQTIFRAPLDEIWRRTEEYFATRDPRQNERAHTDPKHKMALVFRWYLGQSSRWANTGQSDRKIDYQVWCGPAMGAFNEWTRDTFLAAPENRRVATVGQNLLYGAAVLTRAHWLSCQGLRLAPGVLRVAPVPHEQLARFAGA